VGNCHGPCWQHERRLAVGSWVVLYPAALDVLNSNLAATHVQLLGAYGDVRRGSYQPRVRVWPVAHVRSLQRDADGHEDGVVGGGAADVDAVAGCAVVAVLVLDDHAEAEGNGWKVGLYWAQEIFGLEMWACLSAHASRSWVNLG